MRMAAKRLAAHHAELGEGTRAGARPGEVARAEVIVDALEHLALGAGHLGVLDLGRFAQARALLAPARGQLRVGGGELAEVRHRLDVDVERVQEEPARGAVGARVARIAQRDRVQRDWCRRCPRRARPRSPRTPAARRSCRCPRCARSVAHRAAPPRPTPARRPRSPAAGSSGRARPRWCRCRAASRPRRSPGGDSPRAGRRGSGSEKARTGPESAWCSSRMASLMGLKPSSRTGPPSSVMRHESTRPWLASFRWMRTPRASSRARMTVIGGTTRCQAARSCARSAFSGSPSPAPIARSSARKVSSEAGRHWPQMSW